MKNETRGINLCRGARERYIAHMSVSRLS